MKIENPHIDHNLLMSFLTGEADSLQVEEVNRWLSVSEDHALYLKSLELLWIETGKLMPPPVAVDKALAWEHVSSKLNFETAIKVEKVGKPFHNVKLLLRVAAVLTVLIGSYAIFKLIRGDVETQTIASNNQIISDTLSDGSVITLNSNSVLQFPDTFNRNTRKVRLKGEAFFEVAHMENKPFFVEIDGGAIVKVLGTSFNIKENREEHSVEVYVKTGTVELSGMKNGNLRSSVILKAGEKGKLDTQTGFTEKTINLGMNAVDVSWLNQTFVFEGVRLENVAVFLEGYYYIKIEFAQEEIKDMLLTATFKNDNIDEIMMVITESFNLELKKEDGKFIFNEPQH
jgi:transmembrane sensor